MKVALSPGENVEIAIVEGSTIIGTLSLSFGTAVAAARKPGRPAASASAAAAPKGRRKRRKMSPEARAKIAAAQKRRWAKVRGK